MTTIPGEFSEAFINERINVVTGTLATSMFPSQEAHLARFQARSTNISSMWLGVGVTGTAWELSAGYDTGWISVPQDNLSHYRHQSPSGSANYLAYWVQW